MNNHKLGLVVILVSTVGILIYYMLLRSTTHEIEHLVLTDTQHDAILRNHINLHNYNKHREKHWHDSENTQTHASENTLKTNLENSKRQDSENLHGQNSENYKRHNSQNFQTLNSGNTPRQDADNIKTGLGNFPKQDSETPHKPQPNIVFILADDYGFNDIGYHGSQIRTPNLDRLAYDGVRLENYYVQPICSPSRTQFLSGRYQIHTGLQHSIIWKTYATGEPLDSKLLPQKLQEAGYTTHMVGKWHVGFYKKEYLPTSRGFQSFYGFYTGAADHYTHMGCDYNTGPTTMCGYDFREDTEVNWDVRGNYSTQLFTDRAVDIINRHDHKKPLFLYLSYQAVHTPLQVPDKYNQPYTNITDSSRRTYAGMVAAMDEGIGKVTRALVDTGLMDNTVLVFSTDNGGNFDVGGNNWPLRGKKNSTWEGGVRAVGFVHSPLLQQQGTINRHLIHISDWFPTFVGLAQGNFRGTKELDGFDQWLTISKNATSPRHEILHNIDPLTPKVGHDMFPGIFDTRVRAAIRVGDWKLITGYPGNGRWMAEPNSGHTSILQEPDRGQISTLTKPNTAQIATKSEPKKGTKSEPNRAQISIKSEPKGQIGTQSEPNRGQMSAIIERKYPSGTRTKRDTNVNEKRRLYNANKNIYELNITNTKTTTNNKISGFATASSEVNNTQKTNMTAAALILRYAAKIRKEINMEEQKIERKNQKLLEVKDAIKEENKNKHTKNYWLFNIAEDPYERNDLSAKFPMIVKTLIDRLSYYNRSAVPAWQLTPDPEANPALHGGVWGPWR